MFIYPYNPRSKSVRALANALPAKVIRLQNSKFRGGERKVVINWGCPGIENLNVFNSRLLNAPMHVHTASNKLLFFTSNVPNTPPYTTDPEVARRWLWNDNKIVSRYVLNGHSGEGIKIYNGRKDYDRFIKHERPPLYVVYIPKKDEYRVHVINGKVIDIQRKARRKDVPDDQVNWQVRNHENGFIYARENVDREHIPYYDTLVQYALDTIKHVGLDFGAVDIIYSDKYNRCYVLEVNTAPGLEGTTLEKYVEAFRRI